MSETVQLPDTVSLVDRTEGPVLRVDHDRVVGEVHLHGAHVTSWAPAGGVEQLWLSSQSGYGVGSAIRGGVPICFPWFAKGPGDWEPQHGFARRLPWRLHHAVEDDHGVTLGLRLASADVPAGTEGGERWPYGFTAEFSVTFAATLTLSLAVTNCSDRPMPVGGALHTYLAVPDVERLTIRGLEDVRYVDKVDGGEHDQQGAITFTGETDRVYAGSGIVVLADDGVPLGAVRNTGVHHTVVWNPGRDKAAAMADFPDDGWRAMVCVEAAIPYGSEVTVPPGETRTFGQQVVPASA